MESSFPRNVKYLSVYQPLDRFGVQMVQMSEDRMLDSKREKETHRESGARVPQTSRRQYRGVMCVSPSTHQTTDRDRRLVRIKKRGRLGRCDEVTTSFPPGAHSDVHGSDRVAQANAHGQHLPCPPRNEFPNRGPLLRKDRSWLALQTWRAAHLL